LETKEESSKADLNQKITGKKITRKIKNSPNKSIEKKRENLQKKTSQQSQELALENSKPHTASSWC
jgi:hypothetical protein